jgi:peroxiredoxin
MHSNLKIAKTTSGHSVKYIFICFFLSFNTFLKAQYNDSVFTSSAISGIELHDVRSSKNIFLNKEPKKSSLTLFVFLSPECPICQLYSAKLKDLDKQFADYTTIYGIIPGKAYSNKVIKKFALQYKIQFPLLIDHDEKLTSYLQASVTPQVIVLDDKSDLVYKGAIDNGAVSVGKQRVNTTAFFLRDALEQFLAGKTVLIKRTKAVGCRINDY